jgi:CheY-like chemotaxis protein
MPTRGATHPRPTSHRPRPLVLFIEDNLTQHDLYVMVLEQAYEVMAATRGEAGYQLACRELPDVIVVDVMLPDVDGLALCERLHANPATATIPIIILTGDDRAYARAQLVRSELTGLLLKPCFADRLLSAVRAAID